MKSLIEILHLSYLKHHKEVCLYCSDGSIWTYEKLYIYSCKIARFIKSKNIKDNTNIGIYFNNNVSFIASLFGVLMANCVAVPIPYYSRDEELISITKGADIAICLLSEKEKPLPNVKSYNISFNSLSSYTTSKQMHSNHEPDDLAIMFPTSGSTGVSKIVMLSHANIISNAIAHGSALSLSKNDKFLISMPLYFSSAITTQLISCLYFETTLFLSGLPYNPLKLLKNIKRNNINSIALAPTSLSMLVNQMTSNGEKNYTVNTIVVSGSPLDEGTYVTAREMFPNAEILQTYGLTESSPRVTIMRRGDISLTCGRPVHNVEIKIVNENALPCEINEVGEVVVKGPNVMKGYYKNNLLTEKVINNGWLFTGDLGFMDRNSNLNIVGRKNNTIIVGGINVYPEEVEDILINFQEIKEVAVSSEEDRLYGEVPVAILVYNGEDKPGKKEFLSRLAPKLSNYKIPKTWYEVKELPRTPTGKVKRQALKEIIQFKNYKEIT